MHLDKFPISTSPSIYLYIYVNFFTDAVHGLSIAVLLLNTDLHSDVRLVAISVYILCVYTRLFYFV